MSKEAISTIRLLSAEQIQKANSGHPGLPLGCAPATFTLWSEFMNHNPKNPNWINRDRFLLSAGHGSSLLYSLLHIFGYGLEIEDLKKFRQTHSKTPGHPEIEETVGVEVSTGPLGQGIANGVGFALAENYLANTFNTAEDTLIDHYTYVLCGDGCLMEGVSAEASSLCGTLGLGKFILLYDSNNITIEGSTDIAFTEDVLKRYDAYGFQTLEVKDGNDIEELRNALREAKADTARPTIIKINTIIGYGAPNKQGKNSAHGEPLGVEEIKLTKGTYGWEHTDEFFVPDAVKTEMNEIIAKLEQKNKDWDAMFEAYKQKHPKKTAKLMEFLAETNVDFLLEDDSFWTYDKPFATRQSSEYILNLLSPQIKNLIGGSADLAPSTKTIMKDREYYSPENRTGSNLHFGIREFAMTAMANGMMLHGGLRPYIAGFFVFADYMKPALRMSSLMNLPIINILTHDSIGVGEDGPTHEPIEQLAMLRAQPNFTVFRPCDTNEVAAAWYLALSRKSPSALCLTRQEIPLVCKDGRDALKGGYIIADSEKATPDVILIATGSEVSIAISAKELLKAKGIDARVVSMMSFEVFDEQSKEYKESVLPKACTKRIGVEAGVDSGWYKYLGLDSDMVCMSTFGKSGPFKELFPLFGFTAENVCEKAVNLLK